MVVPGEELKLLILYQGFVEDHHPTENDPHEFHVDLKLSKKFDRWKVVFMIKLLKTYIEYKELGGTEPPDEVTTVELNNIKSK